MGLLRSNFGKESDILNLFIVFLSSSRGRAISQTVSSQFPTAAARVGSKFMWDLWWKKWHYGWFPPNTSVSPANSHSTDCSTLIIRRWYNRPISGRRTKFAPPQEIKKKTKLKLVLQKKT
jgi:hypothetical protein